MNSKKMFPWSRRQSAAETYHRTGGLLPIDASPATSDGFDTKSTAKTAKKRPSNLKLMLPLPEKKQISSSPVAASYDAALAHAASDLQAAFDEMMHTPASTSAPPLQSPLIQNPPPTLPSAPEINPPLPTRDLPAELPGSLLPNHQGLPSTLPPVEIASTRPESQNSTHENQQLESDCESTVTSPLRFSLIPRALTHAKSVPILRMQEDNMSTRSVNTLNTDPALSRPYHKKSLSATSRRSSGQNQITNLSPTDGGYVCSNAASPADSTFSYKMHATIGGWLNPSPSGLGESWQADIGASAGRQSQLNGSNTMIPAISKGKHPGGQNTTINTQEPVISTIQAQPSCRGIPDDPYISTLVELYSSKDTPLNSLSREQEEQSAQNRQSRQASRDDFASAPDTSTLSHKLNRESLKDTTDGWSARSIVPSQSAQEHHRANPEMESLKRKLSATKRSEANRSLLPELNQHKQNNVALQKQIESLMAKLNTSKQNEKALRELLDGAEQKSIEWQNGAARADKLAKNVQGLQNTVDHLEHRLEIANVEKLDAQEELFNGEHEPPPHRHRMSASFLESPTSPEAGSQHLLTVSSFMARIEQLEEQVKEKDTQIADLEFEREHSRLKHDVLVQEFKDVALQFDVQNQLLQRAQSMDAQVEKLQSAVIERDGIIQEKERSLIERDGIIHEKDVSLIERDGIIQEKEVSLCAVERQLDHHKMLLQAELRRHATMKIHNAVENDPLPELNSLAAQADIDKWISQLNNRLSKERTQSDEAEPEGVLEAQVKRMQQEIDFYVREIIYFKLDIKGYKSDIRKLKRATASGQDTLKPRTLTITPDLSTPETASPTRMGPVSIPPPMRRPLTPPPSSPAIEFNFLPIDIGYSTNVQVPQLDMPSTAQKVARIGEPNLGAQREKSGPTSHVAQLQSPNFNEILREFPAPIPATQKIDTPRSVGDSIMQLHAMRTPQMTSEPYSPKDADIPTETKKSSSDDRRAARCGHTEPSRIPLSKFATSNSLPAEYATRSHDSRSTSSTTKKENQYTSRPSAAPRTHSHSRGHSRNASGSSIASRFRMSIISEQESVDLRDWRHDSGISSSFEMGQATLAAGGAASKIEVVGNSFAMVGNVV